MGFVPIFLTLGGFVFLFIMVVYQHMKTKKEQFYLSYQQLMQLLDKTPPQGSSFSPSGQYPIPNNAMGDQLSGEKQKLFKKLLAATKLKRHQYNQLVRSKPYSFVAKLLGYSTI